jgi:hypothetical protein
MILYQCEGSGKNRDTINEASELVNAGAPRKFKINTPRLLVELYYTGRLLSGV